MKTLTRPYIKTLTVIGSLLVTSAAHAQVQGQNVFQYDGAQQQDSSFTTSAQALTSVLKLVTFASWVIGSIVLTMAAFKLKSGDMPGFFKSLAGGAFLFLAPFLIQSLRNFSSKAGASN